MKKVWRMLRQTFYPHKSSAPNCNGGFMILKKKKTHLRVRVIYCIYVSMKMNGSIWDILVKWKTLRLTLCVCVWKVYVFAFNAFVLYLYDLWKCRRLYCACDLLVHSSLCLQEDCVCLCLCVVMAGQEDRAHCCIIMTQAVVYHSSINPSILSLYIHSIHLNPFLLTFLFSINSSNSTPPCFLPFFPHPIFHALVLNSPGLSFFKSSIWSLSFCSSTSHWHFKCSCFYPAAYKKDIFPLIFKLLSLFECLAG